MDGGIVQPLGAFKKCSLLVFIFTALLVMSGCGRWSAETREEQTADRIDAQLEVGISEAELKTKFPDARLWKEEGGAKSYVVAVNKVCLWCWSHTGFSKSSEDFARLVRFENGRLVGIEPVELRY